jgi:hypothetical protein
MAIKISQLTTLPSATTNTRFPVIESGVNYGASFGNIVAFISNNLTSMPGNLSVNILSSTNNGNGTNFKVGDDAWIGDVNIPNTLAVRGVQDAGQGYIIFGNANNTTYIGRSGTGPITATGNFTVTGDIAVNGGDLTTNQTTFNLVNATATTVNFAGAGTAVIIGATTGYTEIRNAITVASTTAASSTNTGALQVVGGVGVGGALYVGGNTVLTGTTTVKSINEAFTPKTGATGVIAHDYSASTIFSHSSIAADFTANITNLTLPTLNTTNITLVLTQGATAYIPSALQIAGAAQSIKWQGGSAPTGNANKTDIVSFSIMNNAGTYTVLGQLVTFG